MTRMQLLKAFAEGLLLGGNGLSLWSSTGSRRPEPGRGTPHRPPSLGVSGRHGGHAMEVVPLGR